MAFTCFDLSIEDRVAHLVLNRPDKRNSMIPEFWQELPAIVKDIDENAKARVIVISSTGPHFSAGLDLTMFSDGADASAKSVDDGANTRESPASDAQPEAGEPSVRPEVAPSEGSLAVAPEPTPEVEMFPQPEPGEAEIRRIEFGGRSGTISRVEGSRGTTTVIWVNDELPIDSERSL